MIDIINRKISIARHCARGIAVCATLLAALFYAACSPAPNSNCERDADCGGDQRCRLGYCIPTNATGAIDAASTETPSTDESATSGGGSSGGGSPGGGASDESGSGDSSGDDSETHCPEGRPPNGGELVINEILVAVPTGPTGDANGDGQRDAFEDEFVELVNRTDRRLDLAGIALTKDGDVKMTLGEICLEGGAGLVVFGGGETSALEGSESDTRFRVSETRFGFPNSGGTFAMLRADGAELDSITWSEPPYESLTLAPQIDGSTHYPHSEVAEGGKMSPGRCADGRVLGSGCVDESGTGGDVGVDVDGRDVD
jgi:hypothetical protein